MAAQFGRRFYRGAATTAVAAVAVAALSASQAPGAPSPLIAGDGDHPTAGSSTPAGQGGGVSGDSPYYTDLPPLNTPDKPGSSANLPVTGSAESGIPASVLAAYKKAQDTVAGTDAACRLPWQLLAAIGKVESGQARGGRVDAQGTTLSPILGPALDGNGFALIKDTDNGAYDGDRTHDRAVGPMQFIPSTWATWGQDGNGDGRKDPNNVYDAALAAGRYLCAGDRDLSTATDLDRAVLSYNHSDVYLRTVRSWFTYYNRGTHEVPDGTGVLPTGPTSRNPGPSRPGGGPSSTPSPTPSPSTSETPGPGASPKPPKPSKPSEPSAEPADPAGTTKPPAPSHTPKPETSPTHVAASLEKVSGIGDTAIAGETFKGHAAVRARSLLGGPVPNQVVAFSITGNTGVTFEGGLRTVEVQTGADGIATAPAVRAGEQTGEFQLNASARGVTSVWTYFRGTVTSHLPDALVLTGTPKLTAVAGEAFEGITVAATYKGKPVGELMAYPSIVTDGRDPDAPGQGPFWTSGSGDEDDVTRSLDEQYTDAKGVYKVPTFYADGPAGTYTLRITVGSAAIDIELTVVAPPVRAGS